VLQDQEMADVPDPLLPCGSGATLNDNTMDVDTDVAFDVKIYIMFLVHLPQP
jgi:hypothetical protein